MCVLLTQRAEGKYKLEVTGKCIFMVHTYKHLHALVRTIYMLLYHTSS